MPVWMCTVIYLFTLTERKQFFCRVCAMCSVHSCEKSIVYLSRHEKKNEHDLKVVDQSPTPSFSFVTRDAQGEHQWLNLMRLRKPLQLRAVERQKKKIMTGDTRSSDNAGPFKHSWSTLCSAHGSISFFFRGASHGFALRYRSYAPVHYPRLVPNLTAILTPPLSSLSRQGAKAVCAHFT